MTRSTAKTGEHARWLAASPYSLRSFGYGRLLFDTQKGKHGKNQQIPESED